MTTSITPRLGAIVLYTLSELDARDIVLSRRQAGSGTSRGNDPHEGDTYPALIVRDWASAEHLALAADGKLNRVDGTLITEDEALAQSSVNLQVFLDGNDAHWATSRSVQTGDDARGHWVPRT